MNFQSLKRGWPIHVTRGPWAFLVYRVTSQVLVYRFTQTDSNRAWSWHPFKQRLNKVAHLNATVLGVRVIQTGGVLIVVKSPEYGPNNSTYNLPQQHHRLSNVSCFFFFVAYLSPFILTARAFFSVFKHCVLHIVLSFSWNAFVCEVMFAKYDSGDEKEDDTEVDKEHEVGGEPLQQMPGSKTKNDISG